MDDPLQGMLKGRNEINRNQLGMHTVDPTKIILEFPSFIMIEEAWQRMYTIGQMRSKRKRVNVIVNKSNKKD